jgi:hypothetical protein
MSVNYNLISAELSAEDQAAIINSVKGIEALLPFAITLPSDERATFPGVGINRIAFCEKAYEYAVANPELAPSYLNMAEFEKDAKLVKQLQALTNHLVPLVDKLKDTWSVVGAEAFNSARVFYHHVKNAASANVPGASAIAKELGKHFKKGAYNTSTPEEETETPEPQENAVNEVPAAVNT